MGGSSPAVLRPVSQIHGKIILKSSYISYIIFDIIIYLIGGGGGYHGCVSVKERGITYFD